MVDIDRKRLPQWAWLLLGLFGALVAGQLVNLLVLFPLGMSVEYSVLPVIATMAPVLFLLNVWHDETRSQYWEHARAHYVGDVIFVMVAAAVGAGLALLVLLETSLPRFAIEIVSMVVGFTLAWGIFYFRNLDLYRGGPTS